MDRVSMIAHLPSASKSCEKEVVTDSAQQLREILRYSAALISFQHVDGRYVSMSARHAELLSLTPERAAGVRPEDVYPEKYAVLDLCRLHRAVQERTAIHSEETMPSAFGNRRLRVVRFPLYGADGRVASVGKIAVDVTDLARARNAAREAERHYQQLLQEIERARASHTTHSAMHALTVELADELRPPVRAMLRFTAFLHEEIGSAGFHVEHWLQRIEAHCRQVIATLERTLHLMRVAQIELRKRTVDCGALARDVVANFATESRRSDVAIAVNLDCTCEADPVLLRQVFGNLLSNAVKYTRGRKDARVDICARPEGDAVLFTVRDNGVGFDMTAAAGKLFRAFQRLHDDAEFEGAGLGLAVAKCIIERHGGQLWAEGRANEGAAFHFTLPDRAFAHA